MPHPSANVVFRQFPQSSHTSAVKLKTARGGCTLRCAPLLLSPSRVNCFRAGGERGRGAHRRVHPRELFWVWQLMYGMIAENWRKTTLAEGWGMRVPYHPYYSFYEREDGAGNVFLMKCLLIILAFLWGLLPRDKLTQRLATYLSRICLTKSWHREDERAR